MYSYVITQVHAVGFRPANVSDYTEINTITITLTGTDHGHQYGFASC